MPIYEYQCNECAYKFETLQKINDKPLQECPACGVQSLRKLVSAVAFRLKGDGWYETDFKDKKKQKNLLKPDEKPQTGSNVKKSNGGKGKKSASSVSDSRPAQKSTKSTDTSASTASD